MLRVLLLFLVDTSLSHLALWMGWDGRTWLTPALWTRTFALYLLMGVAVLALHAGLKRLPVPTLQRFKPVLEPWILLAILAGGLLGPRLQPFLHGTPNGSGALLLLLTVLGGGLGLEGLSQRLTLTTSRTGWMAVPKGLWLAGISFLLVGTKVNIHLLGGSPLLPQNLRINAMILGGCLVGGLLLAVSLQRWQREPARISRVQFPALLVILHLVTLTMALRVTPGVTLEPPSPTGQENATSGAPLPTETRPNVLLIIVDTLRADRLGAYGYAQAKTPHIDALAKESWLFRTHTSSSPWTYPAIGTLLTGHSPTVHRGQAWSQPSPSVSATPPNPVQPETAQRVAHQRRALLGVQPLRADLPTLATLLEPLGYRTGLIGSNPCLARSLGMGAGIQWHGLALRTGLHYTVLAQMLEPFGLRPLDPPETTADARSMVDQFIAFLRQGKKDTDQGDPRPFLLVAHLMDPHWPYLPPERLTRAATGPEDDMQRWSRLYDGEVAFVDEQLGRLIDALRSLGKLENTVIALTSDHGEAFGEHGSWHDPTDMPDVEDPYWTRQTLHGHSLYQELLHVPFLLRAPGQAPRDVQRPSRGVDVLPTLLALVGASAPAGLEGQDLISAIEHDPLPGLSESMLLGEEKKAWLEPPLKLIFKPTWAEQERLELYDLTADPGEERNLAGERTEEAQALLSRLNARRAELETLKGPYSPPPVTSGRGIPANTLETLKALGYTN